MIQNPKYYRSRIKAIAHLIGQNPVNQEKNNDRILLRNGYIPENLKEQSEKLIADAIPTENTNLPLSFVEICSFDTWFAMHPEKIAGTEFVTTSREFPIMVRGTKDEIVSTLTAGIKDGKEKRIRLMKIQADSKLKLLNLLNTVAV